MKIDNLPIGTKLMWDAPPNEYIDPNKRIVYPALIIEKHKDNPHGIPPQNGWVKVKTGHTSNWMGPVQEYLREPNEEELKTLTWPEIN